MPKANTNKTTSAIPLMAAVAASAFEIVNDFSIPERGHKYPWLTLTVGQTAIFEPTTTAEFNRIIRSATAAAVRHKRRFATRKLPLDTRVGERTLAHGGLAVQYLGERTTPVKKRAKKRVKVATPVNTIDFAQQQQTA